MEEPKQSDNPIKVGSLLAAIGREVGLTEADVERINQLRDKTPAEPMNMEEHLDTSIAKRIAQADAGQTKPAEEVFDRLERKYREISGPQG